MPEDQLKKKDNVPIQVPQFLSSTELLQLITQAKARDEKQVKSVTNVSSVTTVKTMLKKKRWW